MTSERMATMAAPDEESDDSAAPPESIEIRAPFPDTFVSAINSLPESTAPTRLRTAWKPKQDENRLVPGKPSAKPALSHRAVRSSTGGVRAPLSAPSSPPQPASAAPDAPPLTYRPPPRPQRVAPITPVHMPSYAAAAHSIGTNPRAKPRRIGIEERYPRGRIVAGKGDRPLRPRVEQWLGTALIIAGVLIALGALGGNYLIQRHQQTENDQFVTSLAQFGPTPTPLTARATLIAARGSAGAGTTGGVSARDSAGAGTTGNAPSGGSTGAGGVPPRATPDAGGAEGDGAAVGVLPLPVTHVSGTAPVPGNGANGGLPRTPQPAGMNATRPTGQAAATAPPGGPPPIVAGNSPPQMRPQITATPLPMQNPAPRPPAMNIAPPPIAPVQPAPQPTATPQPEQQPQTDMNGNPASEAEPTPTPEPPPRQPIPTHITIPALRVNSNITEVGISPTEIDGQDVYIWDVAAYAVGHHFSSANPGEGDNVVLSGHDDWQGEVFRDLYKLRKDDKILVQAGDKSWSYHVETVLRLQEIGVPLEQRLQNALYIGATGDERLTLITCWPYGVDDHRLVVIARPDF